jgi:hypothetical protein
MDNQNTTVSLGMIFLMDKEKLPMKMVTVTTECLKKVKKMEMDLLHTLKLKIDTRVNSGKIKEQDLVP